ncbi:MAG: hypothetical protein AB199_04420 [Parcubacteria bacterium C7867-004]|nr:MAG: hypothetical protein AB199_04420 [Parcubacteria bacterium C7867-004]
MRYHLLAVVVLLLLIVLGVYSYLHHSSSVRYLDTDPAYNRAYWKERIEATGSADTYAEFTERNQRAEQGRQHFSAHVIGALIAEKEGASGITICDAAFGFGCYHGLFGDLIAKGGDAMVADLDAACLSKFGPLGTGCQHGIGHGVLEYTGYDAITEALELCGHTTQVVPLLGCTSGVFMEYNTPLAGPSDALVPSIRTFDAEAPYRPCTDIAQKYQSSCYFELGHWFRITLNDDYERIGELCGALASSARTHCFLGVGAMIGPMEEYDVPKARAACATFKADDENYCRAGLRWSLYQVPEQRSQAVLACEDSDPVRVQACELFGDLTEGAEGD